MTAADRDPLTIAREVLETAHEDETVTVCSVPDNKAAALARAALRLSALADRLDAEADRMGSRGGAFTARAFATEIRNALNGENRD